MVLNTNATREAVFWQKIFFNPHRSPNSIAFADFRINGVVELEPKLAIVVGPYLIAFFIIRAKSQTTFLHKSRFEMEIGESI